MTINDDDDGGKLEILCVDVVELKLISFTPLSSTSILSSLRHSYKSCSRLLNSPCCQFNLFCLVKIHNFIFINGS